MLEKPLKSLSIVSPVYRAAELLTDLCNRLDEVLPHLTDDYEIILVNDGCPDLSWETIKNLCKQNKNIKGINLSRNFGQHYAITAGLSCASKDWICVMDCDLQDQPEEIEKFVEPALQGFEVILARRFERQDTFFKRLASSTFYKILSYLTGSEQDASIANFGLYHSKVIHAILSSNEKIRYFPTMVQWAGFKKIKVDIIHAARTSGKSSYNLKKMLRLALDIILAYTDKPLRMVVKLGIGISLFSFVFVGYVVWNALAGNYTVLGYASILASIWFLSGILILIVGITGLYIGKTFEQTKDRPSFIISEVLNVN